MSAFFNSGDFGIFAQNVLKPMVGIWWREESFVPFAGAKTLPLDHTIKYCIVLA